MRRLLFGLLLIGGGVGCTGIQPVGPLAKHHGRAPKGEPLVDDKPDVVTVPAPRPVPPATLIYPDDVNADPAGAIQRFETELDADRQTIQKVPGRPAEVSVIKGGVKQE